MRGPRNETKPSRTAKGGRKTASQVLISSNRGEKAASGERGDVGNLFRIKHLLAIGVTCAGSLWAQGAAPQFDALNVISYQPSFSPGVVAVIFGENLTPSDQIGCVFSEQVGWSTNLRGVQVSVNQSPAPIATHCRLPQSDGGSQDVITCQFPTGLAPGPVQIVVSVNGQASAPLNVTLQSHSPALGEFLTEAGQQLGAFRHSQSGELVTAAAPAGPGELLTIIANGLGPTDPAVPAGTVTPPASPATVTAPDVDIDGEQAEVGGAHLQAGRVGVYEVTFRVPEAATAGIHGVRLTMDGVTSNQVALVVTSPGSGPAISAVVNAASFQPNAPAAPGSIVSVFLTNLSGQASTSLFPATAFAGLSVTFNGIRAPLFAVVPQSGQINVLAPTELAESGEADVRVTTASGGSAVFPLQMASASPGIFRISDPSNPGRLFAAALLANTAWMAIPDSVAQAFGMPVNCESGGVRAADPCGHPLRAGEFLQLYLTGMGKATPDGNPEMPPLATGDVAPAGGGALYRTLIVPTVTIGGLPTQVSFSGLAPGLAGLYQINAIVPQGVPTGDAIPVEVTTPNGRTDSAMIATQQ